VGLVALRVVGGAASRGQGEGRVGNDACAGDEKERNIKEVGK